MSTVPEVSAVPASRRSRLVAARDALGATVGAVLGLVPHVLHHIGLVAGTAVVAGVGGNALFYALGLLLSVPMLRRLHRRFRTWQAPALAVLVFTGLFSLSAFVVGPALTGEDGRRKVPAPAPSAPPHTTHHSSR